MKRNIYKGLKGIPSVCDKCGAEWELGTRKIGETCGSGGCTGKLKPMNKR